MSELFPDIPTFIACALIMAGAQLIYATVGFGAGMFSVTLLAMVLPELTDVVAVLLILTLVTEVSVLARDWRRARVRLLIGLLPTMAIGLWIGTEVLVTGDVSFLKRALGLVVAAAGLWFLFEQPADVAPDCDVNRADGELVTGDTSAGKSAPAKHHRELWAIPVGFFSVLLVTLGVLLLIGVGR